MVDERAGVALTFVAVFVAGLLDVMGMLPGLGLVVGFIAALVLIALGVLVLGEIRDGSRRL